MTIPITNENLEENRSKQTIEKKEMAEERTVTLRDEGNSKGGRIREGYSPLEWNSYHFANRNEVCEVL